MPVEISAHQAKPRRTTASSNSLLADYYFSRLGFLTNQWPSEEDCPDGAVFSPKAARAPNKALWGLQALQQIALHNPYVVHIAATEFTQKATPTICTTSDTGCAFTKTGASSGDIVLSLSIFGNGELTNAGGTINLSTVSSDTMTFCQNGACTSWGIATADAIGVVSGTITATPALVSIPAAVWLFGSSLGMLGWVRRRVTA